VLGNKLYMYGTDFMSTDEVKQYFEKFGDTTIQWINDSSCTVLFEKDEAARAAYTTCSLSSNKDAVMLEVDDNFD